MKGASGTGRGFFFPWLIQPHLPSQDIGFRIQPSLSLNTQRDDVHYEEYHALDGVDNAGSEAATTPFIHESLTGAASAINHGAVYPTLDGDIFAANAGPDYPGFNGTTSLADTAAGYPPLTGAALMNSAEPFYPMPATNAFVDNGGPVYPLSASTLSAGSAGSFCSPQINTVLNNNILSTHTSAHWTWTAAPYSHPSGHPDSSRTQHDDLSSM